MASSEVAVKEGGFEATLEIPAKLPWPRVILRAYVAGERNESMAVRILDVKTKSATRPDGKQP